MKKERKKAAPPVWLVFVASSGEDVVAYARDAVAKAATGRGLFEDALRKILRKRFRFAVADPLICVRRGMDSSFPRDTLVGQSLRRFVRPLEQ